VTAGHILSCVHENPCQSVSNLVTVPQ
jgi:hypothetical protein